MGNRTFVIMLAACLLQVLVVAGTVSYVALRDTGAAQVEGAYAEDAEDCEYPEDEEYGDDEEYSEDEEYCDDHDYAGEGDPQPTPSPRRINSYGY